VIFQYETKDVFAFTGAIDVGVIKESVAGLVRGEHGALAGFDFRVVDFLGIPSARDPHAAVAESRCLDSGATNGLRSYHGLLLLRMVDKIRVGFK
jgi:hypothetical protein